jgi:hypothetical protein
MRWAGHVVRMGREEMFIQGLVGKPETKILLGRPSRIWDDNIKMDNKGIDWESVDWINLAENNDEWRAVVKVI